MAPEKVATAADLRTSQGIYQRGVQAERAGDWEAAFAAYGEASRLAPRDRTAALRLEFAKSELVQERTQRAERELLTGRNDLARASLEAALQLDPGYAVARERLQQIAAMAPRADILSQEVAGPLQLKPRPGTYDLDFRGTTRGAYEEVARQFGLTASFDTDLADRQLRFHVEQLSFEDAMRVLGEQTGTFYRPVDAREFFVAADTAAKRREYDLEIKKTILLPASETNDEMTETSRVVREIVGLRRTDLDLNTHTVTIRDTPQNVALAEALIDEVQHPRGEFLLDVDLLEVDRTAALNLGITPPSTAQTFTLTPSEIQTLKQAANAGTLIEAIQSIFSGQNPLAGSSGLASAIPPLIAFGGGKTIFLATLSGATATFSQTFSVMKSAERVLLRVQDGRPATFFVGQHYPITLALLSSSLATSSSQFTSSSAAASFPRTDYNVGNTPTGVAIGQFNTANNTNLDLAVTNSGVTPGTVSILLGNGDGTFNEEATPLTVGNGARALVAGEFNTNNNTNTDLAVVNQTDGTVSILLGDGGGGFTKPNPDIAVGNGPVAIVSGEFNTTNNSNLDLAVVNQTDGTVSILIGKGDGTFTKQTPDIAVGASPTAIITGDFNDDGILDLAVTNSGPSPGTVSILIGKGDGTFTKQANDIAVGNKPVAIVSGNFNTSNTTNNNVGLAIANNSDDTISILLGNGNGTFFSATPSALATGTGPSAILSADFNNDGLPDLVVANEGAATVSVFLGLGNGTFAAPLSLATGNSPVALAAGDVNGDGFTDLAVTNQSSNSVSVILNTSSLSSLLTPNASLTPYPGSEYVDLGLKIHAVPRVHPDREISLDLQFDISSLAGSAVNGIPILSNRTIQQSVRLRAGETSVLSGLIESSNMRSTTGYPGLAQAGPLGYLTGLQSKQTSDTELLIAVTPHQLRLSSRPDRTLYAGRGEGEAAPAEAPGAAPQAPAPLQPGEPGVIRPPGALVPGAPPGAGGVAPANTNQPTAPPPPPPPPTGQPQLGPG